MGIIYYHIFIIVKKHQATRSLYKQSGSVHFSKPHQVGATERIRVYFLLAKSLESD